MKPCKYVLLFLLFCSLHNNLFSQKHPIYAIEKKLMQGDKLALKEIAQYFDSKQKLIEFLGYHIIETNEQEVAKRVVTENGLFTKEEIDIEKCTQKAFLTFINKHYEEIKFSLAAHAFLITPLEERTTRVEFKDISAHNWEHLQSQKAEILNKEGIKSSRIDTLLQNKDPECLLQIASELYKYRYRFDVYNFDKDKYIHLLNIVTALDFGVENEEGAMNWHISQNFDNQSCLNLLIYFSKNYRDFKWNDQKSSFENTGILINKLDKETILFQLLDHEDDKVALDAFTQLTDCNPQKVIRLANEYHSARIHSNSAVPTFAYSFLKQLVALVAIYKQDKISYKDNFKVRQYVEVLGTDLSFQERRNLENEIIQQLSLVDISAFEYWALINENSWGVTFSAGRILDMFYSAHFGEILNDEEQLLLFLKKSDLFDKLGIIGTCNNYLVKFTNLQKEGIEKLGRVAGINELIDTQIKKAKEYCRKVIKTPNDTIKVWYGNKDYVVGDIHLSFQEICKIDSQARMEDSLTEFLSKISFNQIGDAMNALDTIEFIEYSWKKYSFLDKDFGFFMYDNFDTVTTREQFLADYKKFSEFDFYKNMLTQSGINYTDSLGNLEYDKIYEALQYNVVEAFAGGGGGRQDNEVYAVVKLLELTHKTSLGFPTKLCSSNGIYYCSSQDRADYWMQYLVNNNLLKESYKKPVSFHFKQ